MTIICILVYSGDPEALFGNQDEAEENENDQAATGDKAKKRKGKAAEGSAVDSSTKSKENRRSKADERKVSTIHRDEDDIPSEVKSKPSKRGKVLSQIDRVNESKKQNDEGEGGDTTRKAKKKMDGDNGNDHALRKEKKMPSMGEGDDRKEKKRKHVEEEVKSSRSKVEMQSGGGEGDSSTKVKKRKLNKDDPSTVHGSCGEGDVSIRAKKGKQRKTKKSKQEKSSRGLDEGGDGESRERDASRKIKKRKRDQKEGEGDLDEEGGDNGLAVREHPAEVHGLRKTKKHKRKKEVGGFVFSPYNLNRLKPVALQTSHVGGDVPAVFSFETILKAPEFSGLARMVAGKE